MRRRTDAAGRYLDYAVQLVTVEQSPGGLEVLPGLPPLVQVGEPLLFGGRLDTLARKFVGPPQSWRTWYLGERQREILLREDGPQNTLLYSAEGGGKTVLMAQWVVLQTILMLQAGEQGAIGLTAPTSDRLGSLVTAVSDLIPVDAPRENNPAAWATFYAEAREFHFRTGHIGQCRSTKPQSGATGSPVQGYTWKRAAMDEAQDQVEQGAYPDIVARLRGARRSRVMATATAKDSPTWRTWRDALSGNWKLERIQYTETPFVWPEHWLMMKEEYSDREWKRRALALDVGPERMVYTTWQRDENLRPVPQVGARDVTARVLSRYGRNLHMLIGHDPGSIQDASVFLKAFEFPGSDAHVWFVVDELHTTQTTSEEHARELLAKLQRDWGIQYADDDEPKCLVRCDPYGDSDSRTDKSVYTTFRRYGFDIRSAAYDAKGRGKGRVPKDAGIEMVCRLLCNAAGKRRLYVATDDRKRPVAPRLVESLEMSERDEVGRAETQKKSVKGIGGDLSDFPAALRYALWLLEREKGGGISVGAALG